MMLVAVGIEVILSKDRHRGNIIQGSSSLHSHNNADNDTIMEGSTIGATLLTEPSMQSQSGFFSFFTKKKPKNISAQESLRAELLLLVKLRHDHIVQTLGASQEVNHDDSNSFKNSKQKSQLVLILQYMENGPIRNILKENNDGGLLAGGASAGMSLEVQWALQVAKGVTFLHAVPPPQGGPLVHADLKSSNVLLDANYNAHISDFGLATKTMSGLWSAIQARSSNSSNNKNPRGSILWMAPEVLNGADPTPASDVYSYSMFLVELMTRDRPYGVKAVMAMDHRNSSSMTTSDLDSSNNSKQQQQLTTTSKQESSMPEDIILDVTANTDEIEEESNDKQQVENAIASCSNNNKRRAVSPKRKRGSRVSWNPDATANTSNNNNNTSKRSVTSTTTSTSNDFYAVINGESLNRTEIINRVKDLTLDPPFRPTLPDDAPQILVDICTECWHKNPKRRPTMAEVESRLAASSSITLTQQLMRRGMVFDSILPPDVQDQLAAGKTVQPKTYHGITLMFSDIVGFTSISSVMTAEETCDMIFRLFTKFEGLCKQYSVKKIDIVGDCFIGCAMEQQQSNGSNAEETNNACRAGRFALDAIRQAQQTFVCPSKPQLGYVSVRFGLASGSAVATVIGSKEHPKYTLYGDAVNTASRMESTSLPNRVQVTQTTAELIQNASSSEAAAAASNGVGMKLVPRGTQEVKGKGAMKTFFLLEEDTTLTASELLQQQQQPVKRRRNSTL